MAAFDAVIEPATTPEGMPQELVAAVVKVLTAEYALEPLLQVDITLKS
jgi:hypothetical protein